MKWSDTEIQHLVTAFQQCKTVTEANKRLRKELPDKSTDAVRFLIRNRFDCTPTEFLAKSQGISVADQVSRRENMRLQKEIERLREDLKQARQSAWTSEHLELLIHEIKGIEFKTPPSWTQKKHRPSLHGTPFLLISDVHFDEVVVKSQLGGVNQFNHEIAEMRINHLFEKSIDVLMNHFAKPAYDGIVIPLNGDIFSGNIHEELRETNEQPIFKSIADLIDIMFVHLNKMADIFGHVFVPCAVGNHGRLDKKPRAKNRVFDNYEWIFYHFLAKLFEHDDRVSFLIPDSFEFVYEVYNKRILQLHGDTFKGGNGIGGILVPIMRGLAKKQQAFAAIRKPFDLTIMGHFHSYHTLPDLVINGSVKGFDEWTKTMGFKFERPIQAMWLQHPEHGSIMHTPMYCDSYDGGRSI